MSTFIFKLVVSTRYLLESMHGSSVLLALASFVCRSQDRGNRYLMMFQYETRTEYKLNVYCSNGVLLSIINIVKSKEVGLLSEMSKRDCCGIKAL